MPVGKKRHAAAVRSRPPKSGRVRYAVVGLGHLAQTAILPAFTHARRNSELSALVSNDSAKRRALGRRYGVRATYSYEGFAECLASGEIDAVYIALPNFLHRDFAVAAAEAAVHVLCEKPLAVTEAECDDMIRAADEHRVRLMTAYRLHFEKANLGAIGVVSSGRLGEPRLFQSVFSMQVREGNARLEPESRGGGPLYDLGVYCINAARYLFRSEPEDVVAFRGRGGDARFRNVAASLSATMRFPGERLASFSCSFGAADAGWYQVVGTEGNLRLDPAYGYGEELVHHLTVGGRTRTSTFARRDQFAAELLYFSDCVRESRSPEPSGREGLADVRIIRALLRSAEEGRPISLTRDDRGRRPEPSQEISRPPVRRRLSLVHAEAPTRD